MNSLYCIIYVSYTDSWKKTNILDLCSKAAAFNKQNDITGMLVLMNNRFIQVLEGDEKRLKALMKKITRDKRHHGLLTLIEFELEHRNFDKWSMGFEEVGIEDFEKMSGMESVEQLIEKVSNSSSTDYPILTFMKLFYEKNLGGRSVVNDLL